MALLIRSSSASATSAFDCGLNEVVLPPARLEPANNASTLTASSELCLTGSFSDAAAAALESGVALADAPAGPALCEPAVAASRRGSGGGGTVWIGSRKYSPVV